MKECWRCEGMLLCEVTKSFYIYIYKNHQLCSSQLNDTSVVVLINAGIIKGVKERWRCEEAWEE